MNNISTIIFDAGGVLIYFDKTRNDIISTVLNSMGYSARQIELALLAGKKYDKKFFSSGKVIRNWLDEKAWLKGRYNTIAYSIDSNNTYLSEKLFMLSFDTQQYKLYPEVLDILLELTKSYQLSIISNAFASLDWSFDLLGIRKYFDDIVISSYEGIDKPDSKLYKLALNRLNLTPNECVFIDDRIKNITAARNIGIHSYHLDRSTQNLYDFIDTLKKGIYN